MPTSLATRLERLEEATGGDCYVCAGVPFKLVWTLEDGTPLNGDAPPADRCPACGRELAQTCRLIEVPSRAGGE